MFQKVYKSRVWIMLFMLLPFIGNAQLPGLPPGWGFTLNPASATFAIPTTVSFSGVDGLQAGDWIGTFYDDNGTLKCGGAIQWTGTGNLGLVAFGRDVLEPVKNGFADDELVQWKFYRTATSTEVCVKAYDSNGDEFYFSNGNLDVVASFGSCAPPAAQLTLNLSQGWNWISFNVLPFAGSDLNTVLGDTGYADGDFIQAPGAVAEFFDGFGWFGDLEFISPNLMYQIYISSPKTLVVTGAPVNVSDPISLNPGWNWIGYKPQMPLDINVALVSPSFVDGDFIQTPGAVAEYFEGFGWFGDMEFMFPGFGYQIYVANSGTVTYPASVALNFQNSPTRSKVSQSEEAVALVGRQAPVWPQPPVFPFYQTNRYQVFINGTPISVLGSMISAWKDGQIRGKANLQDPPVGPNQFQLQMGSNSSTEPGFTFLAYDIVTDKVYDIVETHNFTSGVNQGTAANPLPLTAVVAPATTDICGTVTNAITGAPIPGALIEAVTGNATYGNPNWPAPIVFPFYQTNRYQVFLNGNPVATLGSIISAWKDGQIRGRANLQDPPVGPNQFQLQMGSMSSTEPGFTFKVYDIVSNQVYDILETHNFTSGQNQGTAASPLPLTAIIDQAVYTTETNADGEYCIVDVQEGTYTISAEAFGYVPAEVTGVVVEASVTQDFQLMPLITCDDAIIFNFPESLEDVCNYGSSYNINFQNVTTENGTPVWSVDPVNAGFFDQYVFWSYADYVGPVTISLLVEAEDPCEDAFASVSFEVFAPPVIDCPAYGPLCEGGDFVAFTEPGVFHFDGQTITGWNPTTPGLFTIHYVYTDPETGCSNDCMFDIEVIALPVVDCPEDQVLCFDDEPFEFGDFVFDPTMYDPGVYEFTFEESNSCGTVECSFTITVIGPVTVECPEDQTLCYDDEPFVFGEFTFDPSQYEPGIYDFTFTEEGQCNIAECSFTITVIGPVTVECPEDQVLCYNDEPFVFGDFTFDPSMYDPGVYPFTFTEEGPCNIAECSFTITVIGAPVVECPEDAEVCIDADPFFIGGIYFDPAQFGVGVHPFTLTGENECGIAECTFYVTVYGLPEVVCPDDVEVYLSELPITLEGAEPFGGFYFGFGVLGNDFFVTEPGNYLINYSYTDENGCSGYCNFTINVLPDIVEPELVFGNLQWPPYATICPETSFTAYAQVVIENGILGDLGYEGLEVWFGISTDNTDPSTWTEWYPATYSGISGFTGRPEYSAQLGSDLEIGTYYYASKFLFNDVHYYGGYPEGFWDGLYNSSGVLTVQDCQVLTCEIGWANVQWPPSGEITVGDDYTVYAQVWVPDYPAQQAPGISAWIGYCMNNVHPSEFMFWVPADFNVISGNNAEYMANIGAAITEPGTYYYASRFQCEDGEYVYGGLGGFWDNNSGVLTVLPAECEVECPEDFSVCINDEPWMLYGGMPEGGVYSGTGVMDGMFYPLVALEGDHVITYTYECQNGVIASCEFTITVLGLVTVECPEDQVLCFNADPFVFGDFMFDPAQYAPGVYDFTFTEQGPCNIAECSFTITVLGPVTVECPEDQVLCFDDEPFVFGDFVFDPTMYAPGVYDFTFTEVGPCNTAECSFTITVLGPVTVECPEDQVLCFNADPFVFGDFVFDPAQYAPGVYPFTFIEQGPCNIAECSFTITVLGPVTVECPEDQVLCYNGEPFVFGDFVFDPTMYAPGVYDFTFTEVGPCNTAECSFTITVLGPVTVECPDDQVLCANDDPFVFGDFVFDPAQYTPGVYPFTFVEQGPCNIAECSFTVTVLPLPVIVDQPVSVAVLYGMDAQFSIVAENVDSYQWYGPNGMIDGAVGSALLLEDVTLADQGEYYVELTNECDVVTSDIVTLTVNPWSQTINLGGPVNGASTYLSLIQDDLATIFSPIMANLQYVEFYQPNQVYVPGAISFPFTEERGAKVGLKSGFPTSVTVTGYPTLGTVVALPAGWSLMPVWSQGTVLAADVFGPLGANLIMAISLDYSGVYWPQYNVYSLQYLSTGSAYLVALAVPGTVDFNVPVVKSTVPGYVSLPANKTSWNKVEMTGIQHVIAITNDALAQLRVGDVIGAFNQNGRIAGILEVTDLSSNVAMRVYGNEFTSNTVNGFADGDAMTFKVYRNGEVINVTPSFDQNLPNTSFFAENGMSAIIGFKAGVNSINETAAELTANIYPNPAKDFVNIETNFEIRNLKVVNYVGQVVFDRNVDQMGYQINTSAFGPGMYFVQIQTSEGVVITKRLTVN